jgi:hypothetical protein
MFLDYIEIGASDFDTEIQKIDDRVGITVEPVPYYIQRLPDKTGCTKVHAAISDTRGTSKVFYVPHDKIIEHNLPDWVRGCNSIDHYHPTVVNILESKGISISDTIVCTDVARLPLVDLVRMHVDSGFYYLKVDTEGHDTVILKKYFETISDTTHLPHIVRFESNSLSVPSDVDDVIQLCETLGYDVISRGHDTVLKINLKKIFSKNIFSTCIPKYYISDYPDGYDPSNLPHENSLIGAKKYCIDHGCSGVTKQYGRYEVRSGTYLEYHGPDVTSWICM